MLPLLGSSPGRRPGTGASPSPSKKSCNCKNSRCLKLYCECFSSGRYCDNCNCTNCFNNQQHEQVRREAVETILERNPNAFRPKIQEELALAHTKGCNCKKSACLKKYCECFQAGVFCSAACKCIECKNFEGSETRAQVVRCLNMEPHPQDPQQQGAFAPFPGTTPSPSHLASPAKRMRPAGAQFQPHTPSSASPSQQQAISLLAAAPLNTLPLSLHPSLSPQQPPLSSQLALGASALPIPALANVTPIKAPPPTGTRLATPPHPAFSPTAPAALAAAAAAAPAGPPPAGPALQPDPAISRAVHAVVAPDKLDGLCDALYTAAMQEAARQRQQQGAGGLEAPGPQAAFAAQERAVLEQLLAVVRRMQDAADAQASAPGPSLPQAGEQAGGGGSQPAAGEGGAPVAGRAVGVLGEEGEAGHGAGGGEACRLGEGASAGQGGHGQHTMAGAPPQGAGAAVGAHGSSQGWQGEGGWRR